MSLTSSMALPESASFYDMSMAALDDVLFFFLGYLVLVVVRWYFSRGKVSQRSSLPAKQMSAEFSDSSSDYVSEANYESSGALQNFQDQIRASNSHAAFDVLVNMQTEGQRVPPSASKKLILAAYKGDASVDILRSICSRFPLSLDVALEIMRDCIRGCSNSDHAVAIARFVHAQELPASFHLLENVCKVYAQSADAQAKEVFDEMLGFGFSVSEGLCGNLLARCADSRYPSFAEHVHNYLRSRSMATLATYKALMRVYGNCNLPDKACDLYLQVRQDGIEPDSAMSTYSVNYAAKCGRTDVSNTIIGTASAGTVHNYTLQILTACRAGDAVRALELLREMEGQPQLQFADITPYNHVIECLAATGKCKGGGASRALALFDEMQAAGLVNAVTYSALVKSHCADGQVGEARRVIRNMGRGGFKPDVVLFNTVVSSAVSTGRFAHSWQVVEDMDNMGIAVDNYTVSIMMKASRSAKYAADRELALSMLDRSNIDVCTDDVLLNTALDACIVGRSFERLAAIVDKACLAAGVRYSVHTYGLLIKACSVLQRTSHCKKLWSEMVDSQGLCPTNITLSCMLDALVRAEQVEEAMGIFQAWREKVAPNAIIYSTLIKGYASKGDAAGAMSVYHDMLSTGVEMNVICYTTLIDAQARAGDMQQAEKLFAKMQADGCEPNTITFSTLMKGHCHSKSSGVVRAMEVFRDMQARGLTADTIIFNTLLDGCVRHSQFALADNLLGEMSSHGVVPTSFTVSIIIKMWGKRRNLNKAFEAIRAIPQKHGFQADVQTGTCLVSACFYNDDYDRALNALQFMKASKVAQPDTNTYTTMISAFARRHLCWQAADLVREACGLASGASTGPALRGPPFRADAAQALAQAILREGLAEKIGRPLCEALREMERRKCSHSRNAGAFLAAFVKSGKF